MCILRYKSWARRLSVNFENFDVKYSLWNAEKKSKSKSIHHPSQSNSLDQPMEAWPTPVVVVVLEEEVVEGTEIGVEMGVEKAEALSNSDKGVGVIIK